MIEEMSINKQYLNANSEKIYNQTNNHRKRDFCQRASLKWVLHISSTEKLYQNFKSQNQNESAFTGCAENISDSHK